MNKRWFSLLTIALSILSLPLQATRSDNMKGLLQEILSDTFLQVAARQTIANLGQEIDSDILVKKFREELRSEPTLTQFSEPYNHFSDEEIADLCAILTSPLYKKFTIEGAAALMANFKTTQTVLLNLAQKFEEPPRAAPKKIAQAKVIEATQENFASVVGQSDAPLIIDVFATWCSPCQRMAPILEKASQSFPQIRFVKIDIDKERELARRFNVTQLPTLLFILPGQSEPSMKSIGMLSEQALEEKINEFQKLFPAS